MIYYLLFSLFIISGCSETPAIAPIDHDASLEGYVTFEDEEPENLSADVSLTREGETDIINQMQSDANGFYHFENLNPGTYQVNFSLLGYEAQALTVTLVSDELTTVNTVELQYIPIIAYKEIVVDGVIDDGWESSYENTNASSWSETNDFSSLYLARDNATLFIALDGGFDPTGNTINIYIDKDYGAGTGLNDFSNISGGSYGDHLRKDVSVPLDFGADIAFTAWALEYDVGVFSLENEFDIQMIDGVSIPPLTDNVVEIAIPFSALYGDSGVSDGGRIALVAIIASDSEDTFSDDSIPQVEGGFSGVFPSVFSAEY